MKQVKIIKPSIDEVEKYGGIIPSNTPMVATMKKYKVMHDRITVPTVRTTVENPNFLEGEVSEADVVESGCNLKWLLRSGALEEIGVIQV